MYCYDAVKTIYEVVGSVQKYHTAKASDFEQISTKVLLCIYACDHRASIAYSRASISIDAGVLWLCCAYWMRRQRI